MKNSISTKLAKGFADTGGAGGLTKPPAPPVSYGCEVWAAACSLALVSHMKDMQDIQLSFFRNLCQLRRSVTPHIIFREFAERLETWWSMVLGFMRRLSLLPEGSLHLDILRDNIADARQPLMCANWAVGVDKQFRDLNMGSPFLWDWGSGQPWFPEQVSKAPWAGLGKSPCVTPDCPFQGGKALHISLLGWQA